MLHFRPFRAEDRELFMELSREFYHSPAVDHPVPEEYHENAFREMMRSNEYLIGYLLESNWQPVGYAMLNRTYQHEAGGPVLWVEELYIREDYRDQGIGSAFFDYIEMEPSLQASWHRLEVEPENARAIELYKRRGYKMMPYRSMVHDLSED